MRWLKALLYLPAVLLVTFVLAEVGIRAVYAWARHRTVLFPVLYERVYTADLPPWVRAMSLFTTDPEVGLWMQPQLDRTYINLYGPIGDLADVEPMFTRLLPTLPPWAASRPTWRLTTSSRGIRNAEVTPEKPAGTFRIVVMGDSWTVGVNLAEDETYPRRLARLLADGLPPGRAVEVINYGAIGAGAETGRRLADRVLALAPDLIVVAYAQNDEGAVRDGKPAPAIDEHMLPLGAKLARAWTQLRDGLATWALVEHLRTRTPGTIAAGMQRGLVRAKRLADDESPAPCPNARPAATPYRRAIDALVTAARVREVDVVLVYDNVPESPTHCTRVALARVARDHDLALVDTAALLATKGAALRADAERRRGLVPPPSPPPTGKRIITTVVFRVAMGDTGGTPRLLRGPAAAQPNLTPLFDDGTHGDQIAGDGVWSRAVPMTTTERFAYLFTNGEGSGWTGLENYQPRIGAIPAALVGGTIHLPIAEFGRIPLRSDPAHPDAEGAALIADALAATIRARPSWAAFVH